MLVSSKFKNPAVWLTVGFVGYLVILGAWGIITPDRKLSEFENRALSQLPSFTWSKLWDGRFTEQWDQYLVDQFVGRDQWVSLKSSLERASGKLENHNVFFGDHDYLFERFSTPSSQLDRNLSELLTFAQDRQAAGNRLFTLFVPLSQEIYPEYMPPYAAATSTSSEQIIAEAVEQLGDTVTNVPVTDQLWAHKEESIYFRTDHHWTMRGAYWGYRQFAEAAGLQPITPDQLRSVIVSDAFYGTYYTKANDSAIAPDQLELAHPVSLPSYEVCPSDNAPCTNSIYYESALQERDQYKLFFNGNPTWVQITTQADSGRSIAVFKDSYANVMMPYLIKHYDNIIMIDMRYFRHQVHEFFQEHPVDDILFLYGVRTLAEDDIFKWLNRK